jgi:hypothetical protein
VATLSLYNFGVTTCDWSVDGLGNPWNSTYYRDVVVCTVNNGSSTTSPSGVVGQTYAPSSGSSTSATGSASGISAGSSQTLYAYAYNVASSTYFSAGSDSTSTYPANVTGVSAHYTAGTGVQVSWNTTAGATDGYVTDADWISGSPNDHTYLTDTILSEVGTLPNHTYFVYVKAAATSGLQSLSWSSASFTMPKGSLATPTLVSSSKTVTSITVSVSSVPNATSYTIICNGVTINTASRSATFNGLTGGTSYRVDWYATDGADYNNSGSTFTNITTDPKVQLTTPSISSVSTTYTHATVYFNTVSNASGYQIDVYTNAGSFVKTVVPSSSPSTITGLAVDSTYYARIKAVGNGTAYTDSPYSGSYYFSTLSNPLPPEFDTSQTVKTDTAITLHWSSVVDGKYTLEYKLHTDTTFNVSSSTLTTTAGTVSGLVKGTQYDFRVKATVNETGYVTGYSATVIATPGVRPSNWAWTTPKVSGADFSMTAAGWNSFTQRINDFRSYKNLVAYSFTTVVSGGTLLASIFNQARNAINDLPDKSVTLTVPVVVSGDAVMASYFNNMRDSINSIP